MKVVVATHNHGKLNELQSLFANEDIELVPLSLYTQNEVEESGFTFIENAILKARYAATVSGLPAIADDSGLCVDVLNGEPGIYSARYAGEKSNNDANIKKLLQSLEPFKNKSERTAKFYCAMVFMRTAQDPAPLVALGQWHGEIALDLQGNQGFGYDPVFYDIDYQKTAAELPLSIKNTISHRGKACRYLLEQMKNI